jgi:methyltransferase (TIGR00027 family)
MRRDRPSTTARKVALNVISLGARPGMEEVLPDGIVDATARLLVGAGVVGKGAARFARSRRALAIYEAFDWMMPGQLEAIGHRKAFCERQVREGIAAGATQVLVLGAGYDTLGWRLAPLFPGVSFVEIDHPATGRYKAKGIESLGPRSNLHLIQEDLGDQRLVDVLATERHWESAAPGVVVAEGLTQYLRPAAVRDLLVQCGAVTGAGSRVVLTHVGTGDDGRPDIGRWTGLVLWLLRASGEPWLWSARAEEMPAFLAETGWCHDPGQLGEERKRGVEYLCVAFKPAEGSAEGAAGPGAGSCS